MNPNVTQQSLVHGQQLLAERSPHSRKALGQFFTPEPVARFMAQHLGPIHSGAYILDPAMGSGTLLCALIEELIFRGQSLEVTIDGFEIDQALCALAQTSLTQAIESAAKHGIHIQLRVFCQDFVLNALKWLQPSLLDAPVGQSCYQHILANPPYFKLHSSDPRSQASRGLVHGQTNMYTLFMALATRMLHHGTACFIVPRSFCSGAYFARFRQDFLEHSAIHHIHLFETRTDTFDHDDVLQENLVITFAPKDEQTHQPIQLSASKSLDELAMPLESRSIPFEHFVNARGLFRLPTSAQDGHILELVDSWTDSLTSYGMQISTGPIVAFRAKEHLIDEVNDIPAVPLLWMQHIQPNQVIWPQTKTIRKPEYVVHSAATQQLLVENTNYVLLRRFSAKEEARRLIAAPYVAQNYPFEQLGLENHLNYIYHQQRKMTQAECLGLAALFNSGLIDRYFRISNGNTQVNASELRALPLPPLNVIETIGNELLHPTQALDYETIVWNTLQKAQLIPTNFPIFYETRF